MALANSIDINITSLLILSFICVNTILRSEASFTRHRLFLAMCGALALLLAADTLTRLVDGMPGDAPHALNWGSSVLLYLMAPVVPLLYVLYIDYLVFHNGRRLRRLLWPLSTVVVLAGLFTVINFLTGWMFTIDTQNVYRRGPYLFLHTASMYAMLFYTYVFIIKNRLRIDKRHLLTLLLFAVPPVIGAILQAFIYGLALIWSGMTLSILLLYFNIQDKRLETDYLTGVFNRRQLDRYLREKIRSGTKKRSFSAILLDLDGFKEINDRHGHITGDNALLDAAGLLKSCLRRNDFIARYGGDEFLIVLDINETVALEETIGRIRDRFERFNGEGGRPYRLSVSAGAAVYDPESGLDTEAFLQHIDGLMYENKKRMGHGDSAQNSLLE